MPHRPLVDPRFGGRLRELRKARGMSLRTLAAATYLGKSYVHDFETGRRAPTAEHASRLDTELGAGGELAAMVTAAADVGGAAEFAGRLAAARRLEDEVGAAPMLATATVQLDLVMDLARQARSPVRPGLVAVGAQWAQWAGWLHLATARWGRAGWWLDRSLEWAVEVDDRELTSTVLSWRGYRACLMGDLGAAVGLTTAALRDPGTYVGGRAYDHYQLARAMALAGDHQPAVEALAAGVDLAAEALEHKGATPPWHYYRIAPFWVLEEGLVRSLLGHADRAEDLVRKGLAELPPQMRGADWTGQYRRALGTTCPSALPAADS